jgi:hypothetical protein
MFSSLATNIEAKNAAFNSKTMQQRGANQHPDLPANSGKNIMLLINQNLQTTSATLAAPVISPVLPFATLTPQFVTIMPYPGLQIGDVMKMYYWPTSGTFDALTTPSVSRPITQAELDIDSFTYPAMTSLIDGTVYSFRSMYTRGTDQSAYSNDVTAIVDVQPPLVPSITTPGTNRNPTVRSTATMILNKTVRQYLTHPTAAQIDLPPITIGAADVANGYVEQTWTGTPVDYGTWTPKARRETSGILRTGAPKPIYQNVTLVPKVQNLPGSPYIPAATGQAMYVNIPLPDGSNAARHLRFLALFHGENALSAAPTISLDGGAAVTPGAFFNSGGGGAAYYDVAWPVGTQLSSLTFAFAGSALYVHALTIVSVYNAQPIVQADLLAEGGLATGQSKAIAIALPPGAGAIAGITKQGLGGLTWTGASECLDFAGSAGGGGEVSMATVAVNTTSATQNLTVTPSWTDAAGWKVNATALVRGG